MSKKKRTRRTQNTSHCIAFKYEDIYRYYEFLEPTLAIVVASGANWQHRSKELDVSELVWVKYVKKNERKKGLALDFPRNLPAPAPWLNGVAVEPLPRMARQMGFAIEQRLLWGNPPALQWFWQNGQVCNEQPLQCLA